MALAGPLVDLGLCLRTAIGETCDGFAQAGRRHGPRRARCRNGAAAGHGVQPGWIGGLDILEWKSARRQAHAVAPDEMWIGDGSPMKSRDRER
jgi:hypothetical protein